MKLAGMKNGEMGIILKVRGRGAFRKRITEMGFVKGKEVAVIKNAPLRDPIEYEIMNYRVSLRRSEADLIDVMPIGERYGRMINPVTGEIINETRDAKEWKATPLLKRERRRGGSGAEEREFPSITVALVGNPNAGKTTLFNCASGSRERVGNYAGVTVAAKEATFILDGYRFNLIDLPGTYSITAYTPEELFVRSYILENAPDVVINVVDASNLERNLYLTTQLIDMEVKVVVALNMFDELEKRRDVFDHASLGKMAGIPFVPTVSSTGAGITQLFRKAIEVFEGKDQSARRIRINYGHDIENAVAAVQAKLDRDERPAPAGAVSTRFLALKLIEKDQEIENAVIERSPGGLDIILAAHREIEKIEAHLREDAETLVTDARYGFIAGALKETFTAAARESVSVSERIDRVITHRLFGIPIFLGVMWLMFQLTFTLGSYPMDWIATAVGALSDFVSATMSAGLLKDLLVNGIIAGVGGVIVFLPNIMILFFLISLMEDTGYMARAAFIMDKLMHAIGLHGKSFIPLIMGFGCNVPAIMATRTLESRNDRLLTMLIVPFMSCSARLPVYILFISAFFPDHAGTMLFVIYGTGALLAIASAKVLKRSVFSAAEIPFVMELPPYRPPRLRATLSHMWQKAVEYLKKIGGIIVTASIIIWFLGAFPLNTAIRADYDRRIAETRAQYQGSPELEGKVGEIEVEKEGTLLRKSFIGMLGHAVEPALRPMGFDWTVGVSLVTGLAAKEIVVSTLGILYQANAHAPGETSSLATRLRGHVISSGERQGEILFTPLRAFCFILFVLIYFPCMAVIGAIRRESGSWKWAMFAAVYTTVMAWIISFAAYRIGMLILS